MSKLYKLSAKEVNTGIRSGEFTAEEYIIQILERIDKVNPKVNAVICINRKGALEKARLVDRKIREDEISRSSPRRS